VNKVRVVGFICLVEVRVEADGDEGGVGASYLLEALEAVATAEYASLLIVADIFFGQRRVVKLIKGIKELAAAYLVFGAAKMPEAKRGARLPEG
jgi:hypothetical protein